MDEVNLGIHRYTNESQSGLTRRNMVKLGKAMFDLDRVFAVTPQPDGTYFVYFAAGAEHVVLRATEEHGAFLIHALTGAHK